MTHIDNDGTRGRGLFRSRARRASVASAASLVALALVAIGVSPAFAAPAPDSGPIAGGTVVSIDRETELEFTHVAACGLGGGVASDSDGHLYQWGLTMTGDDLGFPVQVSQGALPAGATIESLSCGQTFAVALASDGNAYAWGSNDQGQLGDGTTTASSSPVLVAQGARPAGVTFTSIGASGAAASTYSPPAVVALGSDGHVYSWGSNYYGNFGTGTTVGSTTPVVAVSGAIPAGVTIEKVSFSPTSSHVLALGSNGAVYSWGRNIWGQLGAGNRTDSPSPIAVALPIGVTFSDVAAGDTTGYAIATDGTIYGWGMTYNSALGSVIAGPGYVVTPVVVPRGATAGVQIAALQAGSNNATVLSSDGQVYVWGSNSVGETGTGWSDVVGADQDVQTPTAIQQGDIPAGVSIVSVESRGTVALGSDGRIYNWGMNSGEDLGSVTASDAVSTVPALAWYFGTASVTFDGIPGTSLTQTATGVDVTTPPHAAGPVDVVVSVNVFHGSTDLGSPHTVTYQDGFTYLDPATPPVITTLTLPNGSVTDGYSAPVEATGTGPITFAVTAGTLPPGLTIDPSTGIISGTPTENGSFTFTVTATNSVGSDDQVYTLVISEIVPNIGVTKPATPTVAVLAQEDPVSLAMTGANPLPLVLSATVLMLAGAAAVLGANARRRRA